jgi:inhibitor of KinA sporulation pathway (predicted exonuclease)
MDIPLNPNEYFHGYENEVSVEDFMSFVRHPTFPGLTIDFKKILKKVDKSDLDWIR